MKPDVMKQAMSTYRSDVAALFARLHELCVEGGFPEGKDATARLIASVNEPFLFVIIGEVKAGKSSFINALLNESICKAAPDPCTDTIQKIVYAPEHYLKELNAHVVEMGQPCDILREVNIVDTPGTNSVIDQHQEITEKFIPKSDLCLFVFPAQNPYAKTSWDFFGYVNQEWRKKIIFVLQQCDRASADELDVSRQRVIEYAAERGMDEPTIFTVSAKRALSGEPDSGVPAVWSYIQDTVTSGGHYLLKMESLLNTGAAVLDKSEAALNEQFSGLKRDKTEQDKILRALERGREGAQRELTLLVEKLVRTYEIESENTCEAFEEGLGLGPLLKNSFKGMLKRKNNFKDWVESLHADFTNNLMGKTDAISRSATDELAKGIVRILESILDDFQGDDRQVQVHPKELSVSSLGGQRLKVIDDVVANILALLEDDELAKRLRPAGLKRIGDQAMMGGLITAVGAVVATATHMVIFDVTGGVLTTIGALLAINTLALKRRSVIRKFKQGFAQGQGQFEKQLHEKLQEQIDAIFNEIDRAFAPFHHNISERESRLETLFSQLSDIRNDFAVLKGKVEEFRE